MTRTCYIITNADGEEFFGFHPDGHPDFDYRPESTPVLFSTEEAAREAAKAIVATGLDGNEIYFSTRFVHITEDFHAAFHAVEVELLARLTTQKPRR